jgi:putative metallohydrolase (TIGR04338 family)
LRELVVLHELAHHVTWLCNSGAASHGPEFVGNYITMLDRVMGPQAALAARLIYSVNGVKEGATK